MKGKIFGVLERSGRSFMLPIAILPIAGLFLGIGESFTNVTMLETYHLTNIIGRVGMTFSGGFIDRFLFGILQGNAKTNWINIVLAGIVCFIINYFLFIFLILKFNFKTPGCEGDDQEVKLYAREMKAKGNTDKNDEVSALIVKGLGGRENISDIDCCATRLRITVFDSNIIKEEDLKTSGAAGVRKKGNGIQVIYGPQVTVIKSNLEDYLAHGRSYDS